MKKAIHAWHSYQPDKTREHRSVSLDAETMKIVNDLFLTFQRIFPAFRQAWPSQQLYDGAKKEWVKALLDANLTDINIIKNGVRKYRQLRKPFVPSPGEFIFMCKNAIDIDESQYFSVEKAYDIACKSSHPCSDPLPKENSYLVIAHARANTGSFFLRTETKEKSFPVFEKNYILACKMHSEGKIMQQIEHENPVESEKKNNLVKEEFKNVTSHSGALALMKRMLK